MHRWSIQPVILFIGDIIIAYAALWASLVIRAQAVPSQDSFVAHVLPFTLIFIVWAIVWYIAGLYEKRIALFKAQLPGVLLRAQVLNAGLAIIFFYFIPIFQITPKTLLFIFLILSWIGLIIWRRITFWYFGSRTPEQAILIGSGEEMQELFAEVNTNERFGLKFATTIDLDEVESIDFKSDITDRMYAENITTVVVDARHDAIIPLLPRLYNLIFSRVRFIDMHALYEEVFDRVPVSLVEHSWFLENISITKRFTYDFLKRCLDLIVSVPAFLVSLLAYPFVILAIKLEDGGPVFIYQERIGEHNRPIRIAKFRTMTGSDSGKEVLKSKNVVTKVGHFLRVSRVDELPQLWDVVRGDLSLIGPRPELPALVEHYTDTVPFYNIRHLIKPGLSGWAQVYHQAHPHHGADVTETRNKLSYDLYYLKNRSFLLDFTIVLKTIRILLSKVGK